MWLGKHSLETEDLDTSPGNSRKISLYCLISLHVQLGPDFLLDFYNMSEELKNRLCS